MLQSEFEIITDIFPDCILYEEIEREYNNGDWNSKHAFCAAYKFNEDYIASRIQTAANERIIELGEGSAHHMRIRAQMAGTIKALTEEVEGLEAAYDKAMHDLNISPTLISMIKEKVKEELR